MSIEILRTSLGGSKLVRDYLTGSDGARRFYPGGDPFDVGSFHDQWERVRPRFGKVERERAAAALQPASDAAARRLLQWVEDGGAVVTTGQQAGLFTGPLFTLYKALTAVRLARALEAELGLLVLPVFWVASEDHDWEEANHAYVVGRAERLVRLAAPSAEPSNLPLPLSERTLSHGIEATCDVMSQLIANATFDAKYTKLIRGAYSSNRTMAAAFGELMRRLLEPFDAYVVDAAAPAVKRASAGVLHRSLRDAEAEERLLRECGEEMRVAGYGVQVPVVSRSPNVFVRTDYGRERLIGMKDGGWMAHESGERLAEEEPERVLVEAPERLSPNVLLRPVVESAAFPVISYIAGPGEIAYWGQLGGLFAQHGLAMPPVYPRASFLLVEPAVKEAIGATGLTLEELAKSSDSLLAHRAEERLPEQVKAALRDLRTNLVAGFDGVTPDATLLDPTLGGAVGAARNRALLEVKRLERKVLGAQKRRERSWMRLVERVKLHLWPMGKPQERVLNGIPYLAAEGELLLHRLLEQIPNPFTREPTKQPDEAAGEARASAPAD